MVKDLYFQHYAAINRIAQELLWESVIGSIDRQLPECWSSARIAVRQQPRHRLKSPADFRAAALCHGARHPLHARRLLRAKSMADDIAAGALYDRGVYLYAMGYTGPNNDDMGRSVCNYLNRNMPDFKPRRILDMGCTVGHSTLPYKELFPDAEVWGIDVGGPAFAMPMPGRLGLGHEVNFAQMQCRGYRVSR